VRTAPIAPDCASFLAAFDQATPAAILAVGPPLGRAAHRSAEPAEGCVRILGWLLHHLAPFSNMSSPAHDTMSILQVFYDTKRLA
jgi:hypothetical protein